MTDKTTMNGADEDEIVAIELDASGNPVAAEGEEPAAAAPPAPPAADDDDEDDDRLAMSEDDSDAEIANRNRIKRQQRRERQRRAQEQQRRELEELRQFRDFIMPKVASLEQFAMGSAAQNLQAGYQQALREAQQAEAIMARAVEAGNGEDVAAALRIRDDARAKATQLAYQLQQMQPEGGAPAAPQPAPQAAPVGDARQEALQRNASLWMQANPWYKPDGSDEDSALAKRIDAQVLADGFDPATPQYWEELTERLKEEFGDAGASASTPSGSTGGKRTGPPVGTSSSHAPVTTRNNEVRVTPERKQALIEAGVWDNPELRNRYLKAYRDYDRGSAR